MSALGDAVGGLFGDDATDDAIDAQEKGAERAEAGIQRRYDQTREDLAPGRTAWTNATNALQSMLGLGPKHRTLKQIKDELIASGKFGEMMSVKNGLGTWSYLGKPGTPGTGGGASGERGVPIPRNSDSDNPSSRTQRYRYADGSTGTTPYKGGGSGTSGGLPGFDPTLRRNLDAEAMRIFESQPAASEYGSLNKKFTAQNFYDDPVERIAGRFALNEGREAVNNRGAALGMYDSGEVMKDLVEYGSNLGAQRAGQSRGRFIEDQNNIYTRLGGLAGIGSGATQTTVNAGTRAAENIADIDTSLGNARAAASIQKGNTWGDIAGTLGKAAGSYFDLEF